MAALPRNLKEMIEQLRAAVQASLTARQSRIAVEMPVGFEYGVDHGPLCEAQVASALSPSATGARS